MFLKKLVLTNVRCFVQAELDLDLPGGDNRKWTVIVGGNGDGKSTILQTIALLMSGKDALPELIGDVDSWIRLGADTAVIEAEIETQSGGLRKIALEMTRGQTVEQVVEAYSTSARRLVAALVHADRNYLTVAYGTSRRRSLDTDHSAALLARYTHPRAQNLASLFDRELPLKPLEQWVSSLFQEEQDQAQGIASIVSDLVKEFLPEFQSVFLAEDGTIRLQTVDGELPLSQIGSGYQSVIAFIGDLLYQITTIFQDFNDPLSARGLLLIDSIGNELHPRLQRRLLDFLQRSLPRLQLVVTTQSLVIAQQSPEDALHYCIRRDGPATIEQFAGEPQKLRLNQLMASEAFGDASYESLEVEAEKKRFAALQAKDARSDDEAEELRRLQSDLGLHALQQDGLSMTPDQIKLLADVKSALAGGDP